MQEGTRGALTGLAVGFLLATALRALLPTAFYLSLATLRLNWTALWLLVLLAPALAPLLPRTRAPAVVAALGVAALPLARFTPAFVPVAALATAAAPLALAGLGRRGRLGALAGLALNGAALLVGASLDPLLGIAGVVVGMVLAAALARAAPEAVASTGDAAPSALAGAAWAALLLVETAFLASPYTVARQLDVPAWTAVLAAVLGLAAGLALPPRARAGLLLPVGGAAAMHVALFGSPVALVSLAALQAALAAAAARLARPSGPTLALVLAPASFALLYFGQPMGRWEWGASVPLLALVVVTAAWRRALPPLRLPRAAAAPLALALLALPPVFVTPAVEPHEGSDLVVLTWNVHQGFGNRGGLDPEVYARVVRELRPDVLVLQEADTARLSSGGLDIVEYLSRETGLHAHARGDSIAVLSRFPMAEGWDDAESRAWTSLVALDVHGTTLHVQGVHLARSREARAEEVREILDAARATPGPRILAGDLNSCASEVCFGGRPSDGVHQALAAEYQDAWSAHRAPDDPEGHTHPAWDPRRRIDVVMVRGLEVVDAMPVRDAWTPLASDHLPVLARVRWTG